MHPGRDIVTLIENDKTMVVCRGESGKKHDPVATLLSRSKQGNCYRGVCRACNAIYCSFRTRPSWEEDQ